MKYQQQLQKLQPAPDIAPTAQSFLLAQTWVNSVVVPATQNLLGGLGVFVLAMIGGILANLELPAAIEIAGIIAGIVFGLAMIVRAFRDEVRFITATWSEHHDRATQEALEREIKVLTAELERIRSAGMLANRYAAQSAAEQLLFDYFKQQQDITRRAAAGRGMSRPAWEAGIGILRKANVVDGKSKVLVPSYAGAMAAMLRYLATSGQFVRTADGDFAQV